MNLQETEKLLGALANETRLRLLKLLISFNEEICVCEFEDALDLPQYSVSRHLNKLKNRDLVESQREGTWAYYSLSSELKPAGREIINWIENFVGEATYKEDREGMEERLSLRENGKCVAGRGEKGGCK